MTATFASPDWIDQLARALEHDAHVRTESTSWVFGPIVLLVDADAEHGLDATAIRVDLHAGEMRGASRAELATVSRSPFVVEGSLARWKSVFGGRLSLVQGVLDSKLRLAGDLPTLVRHRALLEAITAAAGSLETAWQDEQEAAAAPA